MPKVPGAIATRPAVKRARRSLKWRKVRATYRLHSRLGGNRTSRKSFLTDPPTLTEAQRRALDELTERGIAMLSFSELIGDHELWRALSSDMDGFAAEAKQRVPADLTKPDSKSHYLIRRFRPPKGPKRDPSQRKLARKPEFAPGDPWLRFALSGPILDVVNSYRGLRTKLIDMDHWYTVPFGGEHDRVASQKWHRDPEDLHVVKVFTYFSDVDDEAGPFQYIPGSAEGGPYGDLWRWTVTGETYPSQEELATRIPESEHVTARGPAGTIIMCDTSGFHRGGFARTNPRLLSYFTFVSPASMLSGREKRFFAVDWSADGGELSEAARFALT